MDPNLVSTAANSSLGSIYWLSMLVLYVYSSYCYYRIAKRAGRGTAWFAWVPILSTVLIFQIAKKPWWWVFLMLIPIVNIILAIIATIAFVRELGKSGWWALLLFIPGVNLIALGLLAFEE